MNVNLGAPYEAIMERLVKKGYAGNQTEVIRQALLAYDREIAEEEVRLVDKGVKFEMGLIKEGKIKVKSFEKVCEKYKA